jgi:acyl-CoA reductase-like NAD-dependent aldehyde dehydrogenase
MEQHYDGFVNYMTDHMKQMTIGDPMDHQTQLPPIATKKLLENIDQQVQETIHQ